jgi:hypothetical protein
MRHAIATTVGVLFGAMFCGRVAVAEPGQVVPSATIDVGELSVLFRDNSESTRVLSGVQSLFNTRHAPGYDAFDPDSRGASAGLNFEHIISGHNDQANRFTPRHGTYTLRRLADGRSVQLVRRAEDGPWSMASTMTYTVVEPNAIDMTFRCTPHDASRFGKRGYAILFWANYMNDVADVPLHFRGVARPGGKERWVTGDGAKTHPDWNGGGTYHAVDAKPLDYDDDHNFKLNVWSYDYPRFSKPFYYGRAENGMVYILMFDRAYTRRDEVRFSIFKFKLEKFPRPAWDFQYVIHEVEQGAEYGFKARAVWKKFVSPEDCLGEYDTWRRSQKQRP